MNRVIRRLPDQKGIADYYCEEKDEKKILNQEYSKDTTENGR